MRQIKIKTCAVLAVGVLASFAQSLRAQALGSMGGTVRDDTGHGAEAMVTIATQGFRQQALSLPDGTFEFLNVRPGIYLLCAQPTGRNASPADDPFVDGCLWQDSFSARAVLPSGQSLHGVTVPVVHGASLKVRVNDPGGKLSPSIGPIAGNDLSIMIRGPSGMVQHMPITSQDVLGRVHAIVIPYNTAHKLLVHSASFVLKDDVGKQINDSIPTDVTASHGGAPLSFVVNVGQPKP